MGEPVESDETARLHGDGRLEILRVIKAQTIELSNQHTAPTVTCGWCKKRSPTLDRAFKCYHCGVFLCESCAKGHFGEAKEVPAHAN